jgi:trk system potassium uptake protein TrkA
VKVVVVGCGRVGSAVAKALDAADWDVSVVDVDENALELLGDWRRVFVVGHALDTAALERAGIGEADAVICATGGDNTNAVVAQVAKLRYGVGSVAARILDPGRAQFYGKRGVELVSPTQIAIDQLTAWALKKEAPS